MGNTKMIKVYFPGWQFWIFSLTINLLVLALQPRSTLAQVQLLSQSGNEQAANNTSDSSASDTALEPKILSEINRVRTNPQDYAQWLESQRQYYDGIWLKLPGEKPVRTNRGKKALEEAIAFLKEQSPLPPISVSPQIAATATSELEKFANSNNIQYFSYGRKTAEGIVMDLVVDELFPDRRRRHSLLSPEAEDTGVACKPDPRYAKVCAIAYSNNSPSTASPDTTDVAIANPDSPSTEVPNKADADTSVEAKPETPNPTPNPTPTPATNEAGKSSEAEPPADTANSNPQPQTDPTAAPAENAELPVPPQPQAPPAPAPNNESQPPTEPAEANPESNPEIAQAELEIEEEQQKLDDEQEANIEPESSAEGDSETDVEDDEQELDEPEEFEESAEEFEEEKLEQESELDDEEIEPEAEIENNDDESEIAEEEQELETEPEVAEEETTETFEDDSEEVAIAPENTGIQEQVERGALEDGDRVIADDGSLYDFYPIEGKKGDSFTISLESDEFDAFVALVDSNGNTIGENDDISQSDSNSQIDVTLPADGVYNVIVNTYDREGKGEYVLTVSP